MNELMNEFIGVTETIFQLVIVEKRRKEFPDPFSKEFLNLY